MLSVDKVTLVVSFGTTHETACEKGITSVEIALSLANPESMVMRAFTSTKVRSILAKKDVHVDGVSEALDAALSLGCKELTVVPTFILAGEEFDRAMVLVKARADEFEAIRFAAPLLSSPADYHTVLQTLFAAHSTESDTAFVLVGHGTDKPIGMAYAALNHEAHILGRDDVFVGTVEGYPDVEETVARVKAAGFSRALVVPLMLVAGDHVWHDICGDKETSWYSVLSREGIDPVCNTNGLGELPAIQQLFCQHMLDAPA